MSKWFQNYRQDWIDRELVYRGYLNLGNIMKEFDVSRSVASKDMTKYRTKYPDRVKYNLTSKRFESQNV